jgi:capsule polysaccharide export protein KpsC/LpsZ
MGFEALMAGKAVHCYGAPFYAGWGVTQDKLSIQGRTRRRSVEELFYFAYIESSRYYHPDRQQVVEVEDLVDYIAAKRGW